MNTSLVIPEMTVTLEHVESGDKVVMKDSLFHLVGDYNALNVYSGELDIQPDQSYRIRAERPDGAFSQVKVTTPTDFPTPSIAILGDPPHTRGTLLLKGIGDVLRLPLYGAFTGRFI